MCAWYGYWWEDAYDMVRGYQVDAEA
eukprot:COSAG06_NODE_20386_length_797_cov_4.368195_1_plen_25_part_10